MRHTLRIVSTFFDVTVNRSFCSVFMVDLGAGSIGVVFLNGNGSGDWIVGLNGSRMMGGVK